MAAVSAAQVSAAQVSAAQVSAAQVSAAQVSAAQVSAAQESKLHVALLIGVSEHPRLSNAEQLEGSINDVALMTETRTSRFGFEVEQITTLIGRDATRDAIRSAKNDGDDSTRSSARISKQQLHDFWINVRWTSAASSFHVGVVDEAKSPLRTVDRKDSWPRPLQTTPILRLDVALVLDSSCICIGPDSETDAIH